MDPFIRRDLELYAEAVSLRRIAKAFGTPCYVYSRAAIERQWRAFDDAFGGYPHEICFAVKANSNLAVLNLLARLGSGFDIVSGGELERVLRAGGDPGKVVFSGVGKSEAEIERALAVGIRCLDVESLAELLRVSAVAQRLGRRAPVAMRVNPDIDAGTHPHIATGLKQTKFGIAIGEARQVYRLAGELPGIDVVGVACHIGSQITEIAPFRGALERMLDLIAELATDGIRISNIDMGGGLGVRYRAENPPAPAAYAASIIEVLRERAVDLPVTIEPGRAIVANAGILLTRIEYIKDGQDKRFAIVDAGMNDLIRPALYDAWQDIVPVVERSEEAAAYCDIVGPVCETADVLGRDRLLAARAGDLLAVRGAGAYGWVMSSNYNSRPRPPEVMVDGDQIHLVRPRETIDELIAPESTLPD